MFLIFVLADHFFYWNNSFQINELKSILILPLHRMWKLRWQPIWYKIEEILSTDYHTWVIQNQRTFDFIFCCRTLTWGSDNLKEKDYISLYDKLLSSLNDGGFLIIFEPYLYDGSIMYQRFWDYFSIWQENNDTQSRDIKENNIVWKLVLLQKL